MARKKTWQEKLHDDKDLPKVVSLKNTGRIHWKAGTMAIPSPQEVNDFMVAVPKGRLITTNEIRAYIAHKHHADIGCPLTCGIFTWIAAHAAEEAALEGQANITPYWRTLKSKGELNPKFPGGIDNQKMRLEAEGHKVVQKGKKYVVENYEKYLMDIRPM